MQNAISQLKLRICLTLKTGDVIHHLIDVKVRRMYVGNERDLFHPTNLHDSDRMIYNSTTDIAGHARISFIRRGNSNKRLNVYFDISEAGDQPLLITTLYFKINNLPTKQQLETIHQSIMADTKMVRIPNHITDFPDSGFSEVLASLFPKQGKVIDENLN